MTPDPFDTLLRAAVREHPTEIPADLGWDDYAREMGLAAVPCEDRGLRRLFAVVRASLSFAARPAFTASAMLVIVGQAVWITALKFDVGHDALSYATYRSASRTEPILQVRLDRSTPEYELRKLLLEIDAHLVDGPSQLGDYRISVSAERLEDARKALSRSLFVTQVTVVTAQGCCTP